MLFPTTTRNQSTRLSTEGSNNKQNFSGADMFFTYSCVRSHFKRGFANFILHTTPRQHTTQLTISIERSPP
jgi:hypothetical protein